MNPQLASYIAAAREQDQTDQQIKEQLVGAGWNAKQVTAALSGGSHLVVPPPPPPGSSAGAIESDQAVKVVALKTAAGLEYSIMFLSLWIAATSIAALLHAGVDNLFNNSDTFYTTATSFFAAATIVSLPIFGLLFINLLRKERKDPGIRRDQNRKGAVQLTLLVTFLIGIGKAIFYIFELLNVSSSNAGARELLHTLVTIGVAGSIFAYYWIDDHKKLPA